MRGMGEDFSPTPLSYESYSPTRRAGWGLSPRLSTVELVDYPDNQSQPEPHLHSNGLSHCEQWNLEEGALGQ